MLFPVGPSCLLSNLKYHKKEITGDELKLQEEGPLRIPFQWTLEPLKSECSAQDKWERKSVTILIIIACLTWGFLNNHVLE